LDESGDGSPHSAESGQGGAHGAGSDGVKSTVRRDALAGAASGRVPVPIGHMSVRERRQLNRVEGFR